MDFTFDLIEDKIEFFEAWNAKDLEKAIQTQIDINRAIMLTVYSVSHQMALTEDGRTLYSAAVHFKNKKA